MVLAGVILAILMFFLNIVWQASINQEVRIARAEAKSDAIVKILQKELAALDARLKGVETDYAGEMATGSYLELPPSLKAQRESKDSAPPLMEQINIQQQQIYEEVYKK